MRLLELFDYKLQESPLPGDWDHAQIEKPSSFAAKLRYALERAKKVGAGSSRVAMTIDYQGRKTVLKIAKNQRGLKQNQAEADILSDGYGSEITIPIIDYDEKNPAPYWIHTEFAEKATEKKLCQLMKCRKLRDVVGLAMYTAQPNSPHGLEYGALQREYAQYGYSEADWETMVYYANELAELAGNYNVLLTDLARSANWGIYNGDPVVIDVGFTSSVAQSYL